MHSIQKKTVQGADGTSLYYETYAGTKKNPVLFFVHGIGGDVDGWQFVRSLLQREGYTCIAMDVRGHGYSDHPKKRAAYSINRIEEDIEAVLGAEHVVQPVLIGHSGGAVIAAQFAATRSTALRALVLLNGSYYPPAWLVSPLLRSISNVVIAIGGFISPPPFKRPGSQNGGWHSPYPVGKHHKEVEVYGLLRTMFYNSLRSYLYTSYALINIDLSEKLKDIPVPTLLVASQHDGLFPLHIQETMQANIPNAQLVVLPNTNHVSVLNNPEGVAHAIANFLRF